MQASATLAAMQAAEALRAQGVSVVDFGAGEPDFDTPENIKHAADRAMAAGRTKYTATAGTRELQQAIIDFYQGQILRLGSVEFEVRFTPGHTLGHCVFYVADPRASTTEEKISTPPLSAGVCFCGDVIFAGSVGRTDLPGASWEQLENSIRSQIFTLPDETHLLSGHGPETTVGEEKISNPFVGQI